MAHYRKIDTRIWNDQKFLTLSDDAKLCFLFILTHPQMTSLGAMRASLPGLAQELNWPSERLSEAFSEASQKGMVRHDPNASFTYLPNFLKYNKPESPNVVKSWEKSLDLLPECELKDQLIQQVKSLSEDLPKAFREALPKPFESLKGGLSESGAGAGAGAGERAGEKKGTFGSSSDSGKKKAESDRARSQELKTKAEQFAKDYNQLTTQFPLIPKCRLPLTPQRQKKIITRLNDPDFNPKEVLQAIKDSKWHHGDNEKQWAIPNIDWILEPRNYTNLIARAERDRLITKQDYKPTNPCPKCHQAELTGKLTYHEKTRKSYLQFKCPNCGYIQPPNQSKAESNSPE